MIAIRSTWKGRKQVLRASLLPLLIALCGGHGGQCAGDDVPFASVGRQLSLHF